MVTVIDKDLGYKRIFKDIKNMDGKGVKVGIMGGTSEKGVAIVDYAVWNEFGTKHIPARPFMQQTADLHADETIQFSGFLVGKLIDGAIKPDKLLKSLGEFYVKRMKMVVRNAKEWAQENADSTIARKGSSSPLIDTGRMLNAITYEITSGGSGGETTSAGTKAVTTFGKLAGRFAGLR